MTLAGMLDRNGVIQYVGQHAAQYGLDAAAVLAVANQEGLNTAPGTSWKLPKETNISFGPPSWYGNGAGGAILAQHGSNAPAWSWTPAGIDYWLSQVAGSKPSASGLTGGAAIRAIVTGFERPAAENVPKEITNASSQYNIFQQAIGGGTVIGPTPVPGAQNDPAPSTAFDPTLPATSTANTNPSGAVSAGSIGGLAISLPSGLVLGLIAALLLILGAMLFAFNVKMQQPTINIKTPQVSTP